MKVFTMSSLVLVVVGIAMIAKATGTVIKGSVCNPVTETLINLDTLLLAIDPYPIKAEEENTINLHFEVDVLKEIEKGAIFEVSVTKEEQILQECFEFANVRLGSCQYDFEDMIAFLGKEFKVDCDINLPGYGCRFPLSPGKYGGDYVLTLPKYIPDAVKEYLGGKIEIRLNLKANNSDIACLDTGLEFADIYKCEPNPCENGGTCLVFGKNSHTCICAPGYTGPNCENALQKFENFLREEPAKQRQLPFEDLVCGRWSDDMAECREGTEADLGACCKNKGVPYGCTGDCIKDGGVCEKWTKQVSECRKGNEGKECCEKQGVPNECSAYCESA